MLLLLYCFFGLNGNGKIKYVKVDDCDEEVLSYNGNLYYPIESTFLSLFTTKDDIELWWHINLPLSGRIGYYTYDSECPLYIWCSRCVGDYSLSMYMLKDYQYKEQQYLIAGTDIEINFFNEIERVDYDVPTESWVKYNDWLELYLVGDDRVTDNNNRLSINQTIVLASDGNYYIGEWLLSENLVKLLKENGIISE